MCKDGYSMAKMKVTKNEVWAFIPARGGSKSIPLKNMAKLGGRPLIDYAIKAGQASCLISRIICSTEDERIADFCKDNGIEVQKRPVVLAGDDVPTLDVLTYFLKRLIKQEGKVADILLLLQPTSPFILPEHIDNCVSIIRVNPDIDSVQTISKFPHNFHAYNQRIIEDGILRFRFPGERKTFHNKQTKPTHYVYGNLIVTRTPTILDKKDIFGESSLPLLIPSSYAIDVDKYEDLERAEWLLKSGKVKLPFLEKFNKDK